ncbi:MAG: energy-coupling factor ABC transporter substrate-binding protein [Clostridia bacterium]
MNKKTIWTIVILAVLCVVLAVGALMTNKGSEFGGADGQAEKAISEVNPEYVPWVESLLTLPGGETECLLFCLQTALGSIVIGYGFGYLVARKKFKGEKDV